MKKKLWSAFFNFELTKDWRINEEKDRQTARQADTSDLFNIGNLHSQSYESQYKSSENMLVIL